jgi:chromosome segregation ATPase
LLKEAHLSNERLTARVHELERANQALIAAAQQQAAAALASPSLDSKQRPDSFHGADGARMGHNNNSNSSSSTTNGGGVALSTLVAERDAALSEMEVLEARARDAEKNADNMVDAMRQANDALSADMREAQESLVQSERQVVQLRTTIDEKDMIIRNSTTMVERSKVEMTKMKAEVKEAQETARKATTKKQRLESQSLDLKRRLNQLAQDLVASEDDLKITAMNKIRVEQNVIGLRKEIKKLRGNALRLKNNYDREKLHKKEVGNRLQAERKNRRREHENSSRR